MKQRNIIHLLSGGLDSVVLLHDLKHQGHNLSGIGFNYGQNHVSELDYARSHCKELGIEFTVIELYRIKGLFTRSFLTDGGGTKIVPNRNACFLHIAAGIAASCGADTVTIGCNKDDVSDFPDCTKEFLDAINISLKAANIDVSVWAPYIDLTKRQIVQRAKKNGWPFEESLSCYCGNVCGKCDACQQRNNAICTL